MIRLKVNEFLTELHYYGTTASYRILEDHITRSLAWLVKISSSEPASQPYMLNELNGISNENGSPSANVLALVWWATNDIYPSIQPSAYPLIALVCTFYLLPHILLRHTRLTILQNYLE